MPAGQFICLRKGHGVGGARVGLRLNATKLETPDYGTCTAWKAAKQVKSASAASARRLSELQTDRHMLTQDQILTPHRSFLLIRLLSCTLDKIEVYTIQTTAHTPLCPSGKDNSRVCTPHFCTDILGCPISDTNLATTNPFR